MDKDDKKDKKPATTEAQNDDEIQKVSASEKFSDSEVAREILFKEKEELKNKLEEQNNKYKRALADYQNLEKRVAEEKKEWARTANKELLLRFLPVLDTLMAAAKNSRDEGVVLSVQQFLDSLKLEGVEKIETKDRKFDPHLMQCIETVEVNSDKEDGKVLKEFRAGYTLFKDILLRAAQVGVGKARLEKEEEEKAKREDIWVK